MLKSNEIHKPVRSFKIHYRHCMWVSINVSSLTTFFSSSFGLPGKTLTATALMNICLNKIEEKTFLKFSYISLFMNPRTDNEAKSVNTIYS